MCRHELGSGGALSEEGPLPGLDGRRLRAGPLGKTVEVNLVTRAGG